MSRGPRVGVVVLDCGRPHDAERAARSAQDSALDVQVVVVDNAPVGTLAAGSARLHLPENRGFAAGMNAGIARLLALGCERLLLLNNDAVLEAGCLRLLTEALADPALAAVSPLILRESDGRVESSGVRVDLRWGRVLLLDHGRHPDAARGPAAPDALSGAVIMLDRAAVERVGSLDEAYFFGFEDLDWCLRARRAGYRVAVVPEARARHQGSRTLGPESPLRLYYASRNHVRLLEQHLPLSVPGRWLRRGLVLGLNLAHALRQADVPRLAACAAALAGFRDACSARWGRRG
jgi:GT2 family glycosyltransferase